MCMVRLKHSGSQIILCRCLYPGMRKLIMPNKIMYSRFALTNSRIGQIDSIVGLGSFRMC